MGQEREVAQRDPKMANTNNEFIPFDRRVFPASQRSWSVKGLCSNNGHAAAMWMKKSKRGGYWAYCDACKVKIEAYLSKKKGEA